MKQSTTTRYRPGSPTLTRTLPERWKEHEYAYEAITPTVGQWTGLAMKPDSTMSKLLGWPGPCYGDINLCFRYPDGFEAIPIIKDGVIIGRKLKRVKSVTDPPSVKAQAGWIDTGYVNLAWTDYDGKRDDLPCARKRKQPLKQNTDRRLNPVSSKKVKNHS